MYEEPVHLSTLCDTRIKISRKLTAVQVENAAAQRFLWNEGELANIFVSDYRSIVVPLLKSFLEPHLQDLFYKDAEEKSEAAAKALLAEVEAETKNNNKEKTVRDFEGGGVRVVEGLLRGKRKPKMEDSIFQESCRCRRAICSSVEITPTTIVSPDIKLVCSEEKIFSYSNCNEIARWRRHDSCRSRSRDGGVSLVDEALRQVKMVAGGSLSQERLQRSARLPSPCDSDPPSSSLQRLMSKAA
ncbi:hypothetical protein LWI28_028482 [Acer negundo]|uniref:Uncharacterized protein n=1 Tax=Acer negundo TaxID=4023 RepID=A0AAD5I7U1_ACENE|nr:hypothetical protein LWI28_028482 [Acer negundo]